MDIYKHTTPMWTLGDDAFKDLFPEPPTKIEKEDVENGRQHQSVERLEPFDDFVTFEMPYMYGFEQKRPQRQIVKTEAPKSESKILPRKIANENSNEIKQKMFQDQDQNVKTEEPKSESKILPRKIANENPSEVKQKMSQDQIVKTEEPKCESKIFPGKIATENPCEVKQKMSQDQDQNVKTEEPKCESKILPGKIDNENPNEVKQKISQDQIVKTEEPKCESKILPGKIANENPSEVKQKMSQDQIVKTEEPKCESKILPRKIANENPSELKQKMSQDQIVKTEEPKCDAKIHPENEQPIKEPSKMTSYFNVISVPDLILPTISTEKILDQQHNIVHENVGQKSASDDQPQDVVMFLPGTDMPVIESKPEVKAPTKPALQRRTFPSKPTISRHQKVLQSQTNSEPQNNQQKFKEELEQTRKRQQIQKFLRNQNFTKVKTVKLSPQEKDKNKNQPGNANLSQVENIAPNQQAEELKKASLPHETNIIPPHTKTESKETLKVTEVFVSSSFTTKQDKVNYLPEFQKTCPSLAQQKTSHQFPKKNQLGKTGSPSPIPDKKVRHSEGSSSDLILPGPIMQNKDNSPIQVPLKRQSFSTALGIPDEKKAKLDSTLVDVSLTVSKPVYFEMKILPQQFGHQVGQLHQGDQLSQREVQQHRVIAPEENLHQMKDQNQVKFCRCRLNKCFKVCPTREFHNLIFRFLIIHRLFLSFKAQDNSKLRCWRSNLFPNNSSNIRQ